MVNSEASMYAAHFDVFSGLPTLLDREEQERSACEKRPKYIYLICPGTGVLPMEF